MTCLSLLGVSLQSIIQYGLDLEPSTASPLALKSCITKVHLVSEGGYNFVTVCLHLCYHCFIFEQKTNRWSPKSELLSHPKYETNQDHILMNEHRYTVYQALCHHHISHLDVLHFILGD